MPMRHARKKKIKDDSEFDDRPVPFEALAELTRSEVIQQVKNGMSRIAPLDTDEPEPEEPSH
jgi:hypothetical protein